MHLGTRILFSLDSLSSGLEADSGEESAQIVGEALNRGGQVDSVCPGRGGDRLEKVGGDPPVKRGIDAPRIA